VTRDRRVKLGEYAAAGVPEYWVVDPRQGRESLDVFVLDGTGEYVALQPDADGHLRSTVLPGLGVDPSWLTVEELPSVVRLATEMAGQ